MSGSFQTLDSMFPKDPFFPDYFFQIIQTSIFRAWLVRDTMHLQVLDFNKNVGPEATFLTLLNHFDMHTNVHNIKNVNL